MNFRIGLRLAIVTLGYVLLIELLSTVPMVHFPRLLDYFCHYVVLYGLPFFGFYLVLWYAPFGKRLSRGKRFAALLLPCVGLTYLAFILAMTWMLRYGGPARFSY
jgi:hypothetical protein